MTCNAGMSESNEFALELLDALTRRRFGVDKVKWISKEDLHKYWKQISDRSFHSRTQIFFDLYVVNKLLYHTI